MNITLETIFIKAVEEAKLVKAPSYVAARYSSNPEEQKLDLHHQPPEIYGELSAMEKPVVAFVGAFSSGKTYLVTHLTETGVLISKISETTSVITVIRHIEDMPLSWDESKRVFAMKPGTDPRSLNPDAIAATGGYDDLEAFTTYPSGLDHDVVIVFLDSPRLKDVVILDCPGVGVAKEAVNDESDLESNEQGFFSRARDAFLGRGNQRHARERTLLAQAMRTADGFVVLSPLVGAGMFGDINTKHVFDELVNHVQRFPSATPHGNVLLVATHANPQSHDLADGDAVMHELRQQILKQCALVPPKLRDRIDQDALCSRIVLFYHLHQKQETDRIDELAALLKQFQPERSDEDLRNTAARQFHQNRWKHERVRDFHGKFDAMIADMLGRMEEARLKHAIARVNDGLDYYSSRRLETTVLATQTSANEAQSRKYKDELPSREAAWSALAGKAKERTRSASRTASEEFEGRYSWFCDAKNVERFIRENYGAEDKESAKIYLSGMIERDLGSTLNNAVLREVSKIEHETLHDLKEFDKRFLKRKDEGALPPHLQQLLGEGSKVGVGGLQTFSALGTFTAITAGLAGTTMVAAGLGSTLAQAIVVKALMLGAGAASAVGLGAAGTAGAIGLAAIPLVGWVILGVGALMMSLRFFRDWQIKMAEAVAKSVKKNKDIVLSATRTQVEEYMNRAREVLDDSLGATKTSIDVHIAEAHAIASGVITAGQLEDAADYYHEHHNILRETQQDLAV